MPIAVIGSGPAGLMAALYGSRGGKDTFIITGNKPGGLLMDTTEVANWPGEHMIMGPDIIEKLQQQAHQHGVTVVHDAVESIDTRCWPYKITSEDGHIFNALSIIIATGASPRQLHVPGEHEYWGAGVTACAVCDAPFFKGQNVVVIGGGDSAIEEAIQLASYANSITILVRKEAMRAASSMQERLKAYNKISVTYNVEVLEIVGDGSKVTGVKVKHTTTKEISIIPTDGVFLAIGHDPNTQFVKGVLETDAAGYLKVQGRTQSTALPGIFAAGDVEDHRYRQAGTAAGYGIAAGLDAVRFLDDHGYTPAVADIIRDHLYKTAEHTRGLPDVIHQLADLQQLELLMEKSKFLFIDFWSETCPSCKQMLPLFHDIARMYADKASFATVDVDSAPDIVQKLFVHKVPCFLVFQSGSLIARYTSILSKKELDLFVRQFLKDNAKEK